MLSFTFLIPFLAHTPARQFLKKGPQLGLVRIALLDGSSYESELVKLNPDGVGFCEPFIRVSGKGRKERIIPIGTKALDALKHYLAALGTFPMARATSKALFLIRGEEDLRRDRSEQILKAELIACGLWQRLRSHGLTHTFATHLLNAGANLGPLREILDMKVYRPPRDIPM